MRMSLRSILPATLCAAATLPIVFVIASAATGIVIGNETSAADAPAPSVRSAGDGKSTASSAESFAARIDLRCWQDGAPIVHEKRLPAAVEPFSYVLKFPARTAGGSPVYLSTWANTTCLIKPAD